jgi:hypothetical protein
MATQISIRPIGDLAEHARLQERCARRLDTRALRSALASPGAHAGPGDEALALWYIPVLAVTLVGILAVDILTIWSLL